MRVHNEFGDYARLAWYKKLAKNPQEALEEARKQEINMPDGLNGAEISPESAAIHFEKTAQTAINGKRGLLERLRARRRKKP